MEKIDDVVKRILSLEMANRKEKLKNQEQLMNKIVENPEDSRTLEAQSWSRGLGSGGAQESASWYLA